MSWSDSSYGSGVLRRRGGVEDSLPTYVREDKYGKKWSRNYQLYIVILAALILLPISYYWFSNAKVKFADSRRTSTVVNSDTKKNRNTLNKKVSGFVNQKKVGAKNPGPTKPGNNSSLGNIVVLSYQVHPGASALVQIISETYDLTNARSIFSRRFWDEGLDLPTSESSVRDSKSEDALIHYEKVIGYISARMARPAGFRNKIVEVEVVDAWRNGLSLQALLTALRDYGGVTHVIKVSRNPVHMEVAAEALNHFGRRMEGIMPHDEFCEAQRGRYEISGRLAVEQAVAMGRGLTQASGIESISQMGLSYEADIARDLDHVMHSIGSFLGLKSMPASHKQHTKLPKSCELSSILVNYADLHCELGGSPLHWMVQDNADETAITSSKKQPLSFEDTLGSAQLYASTWLRDGRHEMQAARCASKRSKQELVEVEKVVGRCAHGGHTEVCRGHGRVTEHVCRKILETSGCDVMTFRDSDVVGDCYLHMSSQPDYWEGDCPSPDYHGRLIARK
mmetsp:Transcript_40912/g.41786  ORF Transcript_40912/g.41786 Transcript_40912/m.41786 type:complete len:508 (+) Transcript_40912:211-1734(+)|eukprot:CAMPEP_0182430966 /NCGR_PEP_ID=MMETSP1167-20130531/45238_1 /TAXON_ID=2988 /ORGANISM="Mallomonas Sp, Strain CCMP3275" /LENGTH=507 /DNA_ID=CAMNT_0024616743 /DNA_START=96 /DNA_END=1619 /DNA_ORIENTATION=-